MTNFVQDDPLSIDLQFGAIRFLRGSTTTFAVVSVEVVIEDAALDFDTGTRVSMEFRFPADPNTATVASIAETARAHVVQRLRSAADILDRQSSDTILYGADTDSLGLGH